MKQWKQCCIIVFLFAAAILVHLKSIKYTLICLLISGGLELYTIIKHQQVGTNWYLPKFRATIDSLILLFWTLSCLWHFDYRFYQGIASGDLRWHIFFVIVISIFFGHLMMQEEN